MQNKIARHYIFAYPLILNHSSSPYYLYYYCCCYYCLNTAEMKLDQFNIKSLLFSIFVSFFGITVSMRTFSSTAVVKWERCSSCDHLFINTEQEVLHWHLTKREWQGRKSSCNSTILSTTVIHRHTPHRLWSRKECLEFILPSFFRYLVCTVCLTMNTLCEHISMYDRRETTLIYWIM